MNIDINKVQSVYSGINGRCCCGCSGKHTYASKYKDNASKNRGYKVTNDEVNDRVVKIIVNKINKFLNVPGNYPEFKEYLDEFVSIVIGNRTYIAYFVK